MHASPARRASALGLAFFALLATFAQLTFAQSTGGRILGRITDPTGAVLSDVKIVLTNQATSVTRAAATNAGGDFVFVEVQPGKYDVAFEHSGFKKNISKDVLVEVNQVVTLDSVLQLGTAAEVVEVTSEAPLVETTSTQMGAVVNSRAVSQLPLNARDTYQLLQLQPGVQSQTGSDLFYGSDNAGV
ncbi:MAG TPA: carboxypeptidase-like regulatory domain-containing protein, partial [Terriglobales bacterium]|nr:carboxypeptidase-like regulatory domain-containing protein [Terriglobales bacterium]